MEDLRWDKDWPYRLAQRKIGDYLFPVISDQEPYTHNMSGDRIICNRSGSGLIETLDPVMQPSGGPIASRG